MYQCCYDIAYQCLKVMFYTHLLNASRGRDCMVVGLTTTYAISAYHHQRFEFVCLFVCLFV